MTIEIWIGDPCYLYKWIPHLDEVITSCGYGDFEDSDGNLLHYRAQKRAPISKDNEEFLAWAKDWTDKEELPTDEDDLSDLMDDYISAMGGSEQYEQDEELRDIDGDTSDDLILDIDLCRSGTWNGDGIFQDQEGNEYGVSSGMLCVVRAGDIPGEHRDSAKTLGHFHTLEGDWGVMDEGGENDEYRVGLHYWSGLPRSRQEDGTIQFGPITIKTGPDPDPDEEDEEVTDPNLIPDEKGFLPVWEKFEDKRRMVGGCVRMFPDWEGEQQSEQWFRTDIIAPADVFFICEKWGYLSELIFLIKLVSEDALNKIGDLHNKENNFDVLFIIDSLSRNDRFCCKIMPPAEKMDLEFAGWIYWASKQLEVSEVLPYLWRLAELANEMATSYDNKLWETVQKQKGALSDQYLSGQRTQLTQTVTALIKEELGIVMKDTKDFWQNIPPSTTT